MKVAILDDYFDKLRMLDCFRKLDGHEVSVFTDHVQDTGALAERGIMPSPTGWPCGVSLAQQADFVGGEFG